MPSLRDLLLPPRARGRALALFEKREAERVALAQEALYRQWRESCDGVRANDSAAITVVFAEQRRQQARPPPRPSAPPAATSRHHVPTAPARGAKRSLISAPRLRRRCWTS